MGDAKSEGRFVWYDLVTTDPVGAAEFYMSLIGWGTQEWDGGPQPYTMWTVEDSPVGGLTDLPDEARKSGVPPHWLGYVSTHDVDASLALAQSQGAQVHVPAMDIPTVGRFAIIGDPQGAVVALFAPESAPHGTPTGNGTISWHELATSNLDDAWSFYTSMFGWSITDDMDMGEAGLYRMYTKGEGTPMGGIFNKPEQMPMSAWMFYIEVPDVDAGAEMVKTLGGKILNGPMEVPGGSRIVQCMDPQGAAFAMHAP